MPSRAVQQRASPAPTSRAGERLAHRAEASAACSGATLDVACVLRGRCRSTARDPTPLFRNRVQFSWASASRQTIARISLAVLRELPCHGAAAMCDRWRCRSAFPSLRESAVFVVSAALNLGG